MKKTEVTSNSILFEWNRDTLDSEATFIALTIIRERGPLAKTIYVNSTGTLSGKYRFSNLDASSRYSVRAHEVLGKSSGPENGFSFTTLKAGKD